MNIKNLNRMNASKFFYFFIFIIFYSCSNNKVSFDSKRQAITSSYSLSKIIIENLNTGDVIIIRKNKNVKSSLVFMNKMDTINYSYFSDWLEEKKLKSFSLEPNTKYRIENASIGDATNYVLLMETDNNKILRLTR